MQSKFRLIKMIKQYTKMYHYILLLRIHTLSLFLPLPFFLSLFLLTTAGKYFPVYYQILYRFNSDKVKKVGYWGFDLLVLFTFKSTLKRLVNWIFVYVRGWGEKKPWFYILLLMSLDVEQIAHQIYLKILSTFFFAVNFINWGDPNILGFKF